MSLAECTDVEVLVEGSVCSCVLPAGVGADVPVYVEFSSLASSYGQVVALPEPMFLLGYGSPVIYNLSVVDSVACTVTDDPLRLMDCPNQASNATLAVNGINFGANGAVMLVGGLPCALTVFTHTSLACSLPYGHGVDIPVVVVQSGGSVSSDSASLSFQLCPAGMLILTIASTCECARNIDYAYFVRHRPD